MKQSLESDAIVYNSIVTPDGTEIISRHRHDYVEHKDENGKTYAVDGGLSYLRRSGFPDYKENSLTLEDGFYKIREKVRWGTLGKERKPPMQFVLIKDLETDHIKNILTDFVEGNDIWLGSTYVEVFCRELEFRNAS